MGRWCVMVSVPEGAPCDVSVVAHRLTPVCALHPSAVSPSRAPQQLIIVLVSVMVERGEGRHQRACGMPPTCSICVLCVRVYCLLQRACVTTILTSAPTCSPPQRHTYTESYSGGVKQTRVKGPPCMRPNASCGPCVLLVVHRADVPISCAGYLTVLDFTSAVALLQQHHIQHLVDVAEQNGCEYRGACCVRMTVCSLCFVESRQCDCSVVVWRGQHDTYGRACDV